MYWVKLWEQRCLYALKHMPGSSEIIQRYSYHSNKVYLEANKNMKELFYIGQFSSDYGGKDIYV